MRSIPLLPDWLKDYKKPDFRFDLIAGLTVAVMLIPQSMAYAMVAGLPPVFGLYAATLPAIVYAWFGTSRQLSVGPGALTALLTASGISVIAMYGSDQYIVMVTMLTLTVGLIQFSLGFFRLGFLINFLSNPVMLGFTSAAAIIIGLSQLKHLLGIRIPQSLHIQDIILELVDQLYVIHWLTVALGLIGLIILLLVHKLRPNIPAALIVVICAILVTWLLRLDLQGVHIVGYIPEGLPLPRFTGITIDDFITLFPTAFAIALVGFMESTAVARAIQARHKSYEVIHNRELIALGLANLMSGLIKSMPVTGGLSRSTLNDQAGARTGMASIISAFLILLTLMFFSPLLYYLPNAILAAIIIVAITRLIRLKEATRLWYIDRKDFWMMMITFAVTLFFGIGPGVGIGVLLSLVWIIFDAYYPHHAELGQVPGTHSFRNLRRFKDLIVLEGVLIFRFDAPLFFANVNHFREVLADYKNHRKDTIHTIILDMDSISSIDSSALEVLSDLVDTLTLQKIRVILTEVKGPVRDKLFNSGLTQKIGESNFYATNEEAYNFLSGLSTGYIPGIALQTNVPRR